MLFYSLHVSRLFLFIHPNIFGRFDKTWSWCKTPSRSEEKQRLYLILIWLPSSTTLSHCAALHFYQCFCCSWNTTWKSHSVTDQAPSVIHTASPLWCQSGKPSSFNIHLGNRKKTQPSLLTTVLTGFGSLYRWRWKAWIFSTHCEWVCCHFGEPSCLCITVQGLCTKCWPSGRSKRSQSYLTLTVWP